MTSEAIPPNNQTKLEEAANSIIHTGSGSVNIGIDILGSNLGEAVAIIKRLIPKEQTDALEKLIRALRLLGYQQKIVSELKQTHHLLHKLEIPLAAMVSLVQTPVRQKKNLNSEHIRDIWRLTVRSHIGMMSDFALNEIKYLEETRFDETKRWIVELRLFRNDFEASLREGNIIEVYELLQSNLDNCRDHLYRIDWQLLNAINKLEQISDEILRRFDNE